MSIKITKQKLMDNIGEIREEFVREADYTEEELKRLEQPEGQATTETKAAEAGNVTPQTPFVMHSESKDEELKAQEERQKSNKVITILWITSTVALAAAAILLFVFFWNPDRGRDVVTTTEAESTEAPTEIPVIPTETEVLTSFVFEETEGTTKEEQTTETESIDEAIEDINISVPIDEEHFPDRYFRKYIKSQFDNNEDDILDGPERQAATHIDIGEAEGNGTDITLIASVKGIEYFKNLEHLDCMQIGSSTMSEKITEVNVRHNPALKELVICGSKLNSIDISMNPELENLEVWYTGVSTIDTSNNPLLKELTLWGNIDVVEVDLSKNQKLEELCIEQARLSRLDLSHNTKLKSLTLNDCGTISLDLSKNPMLETLFLMRVKQDTIDVSHNPKLINFTSYMNEVRSLDLSGNPELEVLYIREEKLTSFDVSHNKALKTFHLYECLLDKLDVSANQALEELRVSCDTEMIGVKEGLEIIRN